MSVRVSMRVRESDGDGVRVWVRVSCQDRVGGREVSGLGFRFGFWLIRIRVGVAVRVGVRAWASGSGSNPSWDWA